MSRPREILFAIASVLFGATWLLAAEGKIAAPLLAYEFLVRTAPPGIVAKAALIGAVTAETLLGSAMVFRAIDAVRGFVASLALLAVGSAFLLYARATATAPERATLRCGCYGERFGATLDGELSVNAAMAAALLALTAWGLLGRKKNA